MIEGIVETIRVGAFQNSSAFINSEEAARLSVDYFPVLREQA